MEYTCLFTQEKTLIIMRNFITLFFLVIALKINAQETIFKWGVTTGINISECNYFYTEKPVLGFRVGGIIEYQLHPKLSFAGELLFSQQGSQYRLGVNSDEVKVELYYLKAPIMIKYTPFNNGLSFFVGPYIGCLVGINSIGYGFYETSQLFDVGSVLGIGYKFKFGLCVNTRWEQGISKAFYSPEHNRRAFNSVYALACSWYFNP